MNHGRIDIGAVEIEPTCAANCEACPGIFVHEDASPVQAAVDAAPEGGKVLVGERALACGLTRLSYS